MEVETILGIDDLKAIRDELDNWRVVTVLSQASLASLAAGRTPQIFVPLVFHPTGMFPERTRSNPKQATVKIKLGHQGLKQASTTRSIGTHCDLGTNSGTWAGIRAALSEADIATPDVRVAAVADVCIPRFVPRAKSRKESFISFMALLV